MGTARVARVAGVVVVIMTSGCGALGVSDPAPVRSTMVLSQLPADARPIRNGPVRVTRVAVAPPIAIGGAATANAGAVREPGPAPRDLTMAFTGDTLMHSPLVEQAARNAGGAGYDFAPMLARIAPLIGAADLAVCHLETPIAPPGEALSTFPLYGVPAEVAAGVASAGYERCSTASNHTLDRGTAGIDATIAALGLAGLGQSGMASDPNGIEPQVFTVDDIPVSHLSYSFGFNGIPLPRDEPWRSAVIDPARIIADATTARALGARIVVVSLHWGIEGSGGITDQQRSVAEAITASGQIDLVVGHHAHVLQPIELVNGVWVIYGLSNLVSNLGEIAGWPAGAADGAIAEVRFVEQADGSYVAEPPMVQPTWVDAPAGWVVRPVLADLADPTVPDAVKARLQASLDRTASVLGSYLPAA